MKVKNTYLIMMPQHGPVPMYETECGKWYVPFSSKVGCEWATCSLIEIKESEAKEYLSIPNA